MGKLSRKRNQKAQLEAQRVNLEAAGRAALDGLDGVLELKELTFPYGNHSRLLGHALAYEFCFKDDPEAGFTISLYPITEEYKLLEISQLTESLMQGIAGALAELFPEMRPQQWVQ